MPPRSTSSPWRPSAGWLLLLVFLVEFVVFDQWGTRPYTHIFPRWNDQIQYLTEAYQGYEHAQSHGLGAGLISTLTNASAQGTLHDFYALLVFELAGPSRSAALAVNLLALLAWQASLYLALRRLAAPTPLAFLAALLPLALLGPWYPDAGSAYDFRLDHLAMCTWGVALSAGLATDGFRRRGWTLVFGIAVGLTLITRFLTGAYFLLILLAGLGWCLAGTERRTRSLNLFLAALAAFALAGPVFWINRDWVWNYYWIGHYVGPESAIRNQHFGLGQSLAYVWGNFAERHLGIFFGGLVGTLTVILVPLRRPGSRGAGLGSVWGLGALFLFCPALILTLHTQKSPVVLGILAPGAIVLVLALWLTLAPDFRPGRGPLLLAGTTTLACLAVFIRLQLRPPYDADTYRDLRLVTNFGETLARRAQPAGLGAPTVAVDYITDSLDGQVLRVVCYERLHRWIPFVMTLPTSIAEPTEAAVMNQLQTSDFVFLTTVSPTDYYPYDKKLAALRPALHAWCRAHLRETDHFTFLGRSMVLYQRREIPLAPVTP